MQGDGHDGDATMGDEDAQGSDVGPEDEHYQSIHADGLHDPAEPPHPPVNGHGLADPSSGSQEPSEDNAVPVISQGDSNVHSQETLSSTPPLHASQEPAPPVDPVVTAPAEAPVESTQPAAPDSQTPSVLPRKPLQATDSLASTVPDLNQEQAEASPYASTVIDGEPIQEHEDEPTQPATQYVDELPLPSENADPAAATNNLLGEKIPSANRLSVSYAGATRRLVIDAEAVPKLKVFRSEGRIEVTVSLTADERGGFKGIAVSASCLTLLRVCHCLRSEPFRWRDALKKALTSPWSCHNSSRPTPLSLLSGKPTFHRMSHSSFILTRRSRYQSPVGSRQAMCRSGYGVCLAACSGSLEMPQMVGKEESMSLTPIR